MTIRDYLKIKNRPLITVGPNETVLAAIQKLVDNKIGALPVTDDDGVLLGIVSERDLLKFCLHQCDTIGLIKVQDVMNTHVVVATLSEGLDYAMSVMKQKNIRHLPVVIGTKVESMISMRDIVHMRLQEAEAEVRYAGLLHHTTHRRLF